LNYSSVQPAYKAFIDKVLNGGCQGIYFGKELSGEIKSHFIGIRRLFVTLLLVWVVLIA
jgi:hypothetical protein